MGDGLIAAAPCEGAAIKVRQVRRPGLPHHPPHPVGVGVRHGTAREVNLGCGKHAGAAADQTLNGLDIFKPWSRP